MSEESTTPIVTVKPRKRKQNFRQKDEDNEVKESETVQIVKKTKTQNSFTSSTIKHQENTLDIKIQADRDIKESDQGATATDTIDGDYKDKIRAKEKKQNETNKLKKFGPTRGNNSLRATIAFDYKPDICKDYFETGFCVDENSMIQTYGGETKIKDMKIGELVLTCNEENLQKEHKKVLKIFNNGSKICTKLVLMDGSGIFCTAEHKILVFDKESNGTPRWKKLKDVDLNDLVIRGDYLDAHNSDTSIKVDKILLKDELPSAVIKNNNYHKNSILPLKYSNIKILSIISRLFGFLLSDGTLTNPHGNVLQARLSLGELEDTQEVMTDLKMLFSDYVESYSNETTHLGKSTMNTFRITLPSPLPYIFKMLGAPIGQRMTTKFKFPQWLLDKDLPNYVIHEFLKGWNGGDGCVPSFSRQFGGPETRQSKIYEYKENLMEFMNNLEKLYNAIGIEVASKVYICYLQNEKGISFSKLEGIESKEDIIKIICKESKISEDRALKVCVRYIFRTQDMTKFEFAYCNDKKRAARKVLSFYKLTRFLPSCRSDIISEIRNYREENKETWDKSLSIIKSKYENHVYLSDLVPNGVPQIIYAKLPITKLRKFHITYKQWLSVIDIGSPDFIAIPIAFKSEEEIKNVYDLSIEGNHNYIANGLVVHNCGYGDGCKFAHIREDYKSSWEIDKEYENSLKEKDEKKEKEIPFACFLCRKRFVDPIVTKCGHFFCEKCALDHYNGGKNTKCAICNEQTYGVFNTAYEIIRKMKKEEEENAKPKPEWEIEEKERKYDSWAIK